MGPQKGVNGQFKDWLRRRFWLKLIALGLAVGTWVAVRLSLYF